MVAVQAAGCAPIVHAFQEGRKTADFRENAQTLAAGLRVPKALGDFLILQVLRESNGMTMAVENAERLEAVVRWVQTGGGHHAGCAALAGDWMDSA